MPAWPAPYRDILAVVTTMAPWSQTAEVGANLAARWESVLTGCFMAPSLRTLAANDAKPPVASLLCEYSTASADAPTRADFGAFANHRGVHYSRWTVAQSDLSHTLRRLGAWHDLAILDRDVTEPMRLFNVLGEALLSSRIPCLILPPQTEVAPPFKRVAIGWNGRPQAIHAVHAALPILAAAKQVCILDGASDQTASHDGLPSFDPYSYLAMHGIVAQSHTIHADASSIGTALLEESRDMQADLLVMGAYGHATSQARRFGGATRHVLAQAPLPVLMRH
ncbi:MAG: universal stress protein [Dyella sp.]